MAPTSLGVKPCVWANLTMVAEVDRAVSRLTDRASCARSFGSDRIADARLERDEKQSLGYEVKLQDVLTNLVSMVPVPALALASEAVLLINIVKKITRNARKFCFELEENASIFSQLMKSERLLLW